MVLPHDELDENRTFFCSELVAAAYKKIGILPKDISAAQYWPGIIDFGFLLLTLLSTGTFSSEKQLNLLDGAKLGNEMLIDFKLSQKYYRQ